jgi:hypothetical protein
MLVSVEPSLAASVQQFERCFCRPKEGAGAGSSSKGGCCDANAEAGGGGGFEIVAVQSTASSCCGTSSSSASASASASSSSSSCSSSTSGNQEASPPPPPALASLEANVVIADAAQAADATADTPHDMLSSFLKHECERCSGVCGRGGGGSCSQPHD